MTADRTDGADAIPTRPREPTTRRRIRGLDAEQRSQQRRRQLLGAALDLFAESGYPDTTVEQICQNAYVGTKAFYDHFDSKEACYIALLKDVTSQIQQRVAETAERAPETEETQATTAIIAAFVHAIADDIRLAKVTYGTASGISHAVEAQRRLNRRWAASFLETLWGRHGVEESADLHSLALACVGGMFELVADWLIGPDPGDEATVQRLRNNLTSFILVVRAGLDDVH